MQLSLFGTDQHPASKRTRKATGFIETRRLSWEAKLENLGRQKRRIMSEFERLGDRGATIAEMAILVADGKSNRICQAIHDLRGAEFIRATDERRSVVGGRLSVVMVIAKGKQ